MKTIFESYHITVGANVVHGNVAIKEHHVFEHDGIPFLVLVDDMAATRLDPALAGILPSLVLSPGTLVPDSLMQMLRTAGLVAGETSHVPAAEPSAPRMTSPAGAAKHRDACAVTNLALFLAQDCNLACTYCYGREGSYGGAGLMSAQTARAAVDWLFENSGAAAKVNLGFFGGEPLLNLPVLKETVAYAKRGAAAGGKEITFVITTNATLLDDETAAYLAAERIEPLVSCDGPAEIHDRQRPFKGGRGSYAAVMAGVQRLQAAFPGLTARAVLREDADPATVRRSLEAAGFAHSSMTLASPVLLDESDLDEEAARRHAAAHEAAVARMLAYRRHEVARFFAAVAARDLDDDSLSVAVSRLAGLITGEKRHAGCGVGRGMRAISVDGGIYPCHRFVGLEDVHMGGIGDYRAGEINEYHRAVVENLPECGYCWARYFCGGGCFYENRGRTGNMHRPDPLFCEETRTLSEDLIAGWCRLSDEDRAYVRQKTEKAPERHDSRP